MSAPKVIAPVSAPATVPAPEAKAAAAPVTKPAASPKSAPARSTTTGELKAISDKLDRLLTLAEEGKHLGAIQHSDSAAQVEQILDRLTTLELLTAGNKRVAKPSAAKTAEGGAAATGGTAAATTRSRAAGAAPKLPVMATWWKKEATIDVEFMKRYMIAGEYESVISTPSVAKITTDKHKKAMQMAIVSWTLLNKADRVGGTAKDAITKDYEIAKAAHAAQNKGEPIKSEENTPTKAPVAASEPQ